MQRFSEIIIKRRKIIIILTIVVTLFFMLGFTRITINSDITSYLKPNDPAMKLFNRIGEDYGGNLMVMIAVVSDSIISSPTLNFLKTVTENYSEIDGVSSITSLINIIDIKDTDFGLEVGKLIDKNNIPENERELEALKKYILSKDSYRGKIISEDGTTTIIICRLNPDYNKVELAKKIKEITEEVKGSYRVYYSGYPVQMMEMNGMLAGDLKILIPIVLVVITLVLFFSFKTIRGVVLPLTIVVISTIWAIGLMGLTNTPLSIISNVVPVILLAIGTAYGIHFLSRYNEDVFTEEHKLQQIKKTIHHIGIPILLTGVTTITGFLSFAGAYITAITEFGIFTAFGVFVAMVLSITFLPAVLSYMKVKTKKPAISRAYLFKRFMNSTAGFVLKNKKLILIFSLLIVILSAVIIPRIKTETDLTYFFPKKSEIRKADVVIKNNFGGSTPVQIVIKGDIKNPLVLREMRIMEKYMNQLPYMSNTQSISDLISQMNDVLNNHRAIPETREEVANLLFLLEGDEILERLVNSDYSEGIIHATFGTEDGRIVGETISSINSYIKENINRQFITVSMTTLDDRAKHLAENRVYTLAAKAILYDYSKDYKNNDIDIASIKTFFKNMNPDPDVFITTDIREKLYEELFMFFKEESEVYIETQSEIKSITHALIDLTENNVLTEKNIISTLKNNIPGKYWFDYPESIQYTAEYIFPALSNAQNESMIQITSTRLIENLFNEQKDDTGFNKKVQDNLWLLTHNLVGVPASLLKDEVNSSEKIRIDAELSGMIKIVNSLNTNLRRSQIQSIIIAVIVVFIFLSVQFKSLKMGAVSLSPIIVVILLNFAIMGYGGIPLDYATMLVGSILIGVGIDYSIHFSSRFRLESKKTDDEKESLKKTLNTTGVAILINALMVALGFFVLVAGNFVPVKREGWMIGVLMLVSASAALIYLPSLILVLKKYLIR